MSWINAQPQQAKKNAEIVIKRLNAKGITNPFAQAGLLAVVSKESSLMPKSENLNYTAARIKQIWPKLSDRATQLAGNPEALGNAAYGGKYGNASNEGYKYRGRGFNQLTFKDSYEKYGKLAGYDLVKNPDLLNDVGVAADVMIAFYKHRFANNSGKLKSYNSSGINDFKSIQDAVGAFYHANTGWGKSLSEIKADRTGGYAKAVQRGPEFVDYVKQFTGQTIDLAKKKPVIAIVITAVVIVSVYALYKTLKQK
jgi:putative chitinase